MKTELRRWLQYPRWVLLDPDIHRDRKSILPGSILDAQDHYERIGDLPALSRTGPAFEVYAIPNVNGSTRPTPP